MGKGKRVMKDGIKKRRIDEDMFNKLLLIL